MENPSENNQWYLAEIIQWIKDGLEGKVVYVNYILIAAASAEDAYEKAVEEGWIYTYSSDSGSNSEFMGLCDLHYSTENLAHGARIYVEIKENLTDTEISALVYPKDTLNVFAPRIDWQGVEQPPYIPANAEWYLAEYVHEIQIAASQIHAASLSFVLVRADSPQAAFDQALQLGKDSEKTYENEDGPSVVKVFRGLRELSVIHEDLEHGTEIIYERYKDLTLGEIIQMAKKKEKLSVFRPKSPLEDI